MPVSVPTAPSSTPHRRSALTTASHFDLPARRRVSLWVVSGMPGPICVPSEVLPCARSCRFLHGTSIRLLCGGMRHTRPRVQLEVRVRGSSSLAPTARSLISEQPRLLVQSSLFNTKKAGKCQPSTSWSARAAATRPRRSRRQPQGQPAASWRVHPRVHHHPEEAELGAP